MKDEKTHFGFSEVSSRDKAGMVASVFNSVADKYDLMNDLMSFGLHRLWKDFAVSLCHIKKSDIILDLAGGSGDMTLRMHTALGKKGQIILSDINRNMLEQGRDKLLDKGIFSNICFCQIDAEKIPFPDNSFDCITIAFGLRNVTNKKLALQEILRALRPGGRAIILEFSRLNIKPLQKLYDHYSFKILPQIGKLVAQDGDSYKYLAESIRVHPDQATLKTIMEDAGFEMCDYHNLSGGIVAVHRGYKL
ncbi:MAG: bifunctional demethylmenaquinone methyltransferase/2-methoxy-6-polyprenyl-1,4-benzoquinol methylase UbiE [Gammaproteobacteria bacterium]|nr:MAG: bifunctional demethylmenaquinone methyltransferase/2-methoxy-6-polyprenyl-1,4-benzoquinol methylase UbiE [Gammaproteobacteria bacterium]